MDLHRTLVAALLRRLPTGPRDERAASLVEYALLSALIAGVMVGAVTLLGDTTGSSIDGSSSSILDATSG